MYNDVRDGWQPAHHRSWLSDGGTTASWAPRMELREEHGEPRFHGDRWGPSARSALLDPSPPAVAVPYLSSRTPLGVGMPRSMCATAPASNLAGTAARARLSAPKLGSLYHGRPRPAPEPAVAEGPEQYEQDLATFDERVDEYLKPDPAGAQSSFDIDMWLLQSAPKLPPAATYSGQQQASASPRETPAQRRQRDEARLARSFDPPSETTRRLAATAPPPASPTAVTMAAPPKLAAAAPAPTVATKPPLSSCSS
jgi:hypothetical protein